MPPLGPRRRSRTRTVDRSRHALHRQSSYLASCLPAPPARPATPRLPIHSPCRKNSFHHRGASAEHTEKGHKKRIRRGQQRTQADRADRRLFHYPEPSAIGTPPPPKLPPAPPLPRLRGKVRFLRYATSIPLPLLAPSPPLYFPLSMIIPFFASVLQVPGKADRYSYHNFFSRERFFFGGLRASWCCAVTPCTAACWKTHRHQTLQAMPRRLVHCRHTS